MVGAKRIISLFSKLRDKIEINFNPCLNIKRINPDNLGDKVCSPKKYFEGLEKFKIIDITRCVHKHDLVGKTIILGGGGLVQQQWCQPEINNIVHSKYKILICWGAGFNDHYQKTIKIPDYVKNFSLIGVRDYGLPIPWVPCPTCASDLFDGKYGIEHDFVVYEHASDGRMGKIVDFPLLKNTEPSFEKVIKFLASGETVITSSYHGAYWATLLNRKVIVVNAFSNKFYYMKHQPPVVSEDDWQSARPRSQNFPEALTECREANHRFAENVLNTI